MPGIIALYLMIFAAIAGLVLGLLLYWFSAFTPLKSRSKRAMLSVLGGVFLCSLIVWDFERHQIFEISDKQANRVLEPALLHGAAISEKSAMTYNVSFADYYLLEMKQENFRTFIAARPHVLAERDKFLERMFVKDWAPEWLQNFKCVEGVGFAPKFTAIELEIDEYELFYCSSNQKLIVIKERV